MNIYVGNLSYSYSEAELKELFEEFGEVESAKIISDKYSGQSKGFGFVTMVDNTTSASAIQGLNGKNIGGKDIIVNEARPKNDNFFKYKDK
jgi:cold-inducible RNA-binding protein